MKVSVIIPLWNGAEVVGDCLVALFVQRDSEALEVIAVDNASHDDSVAIVTQGYPRVAVLRQPVNLGFAGGVNAGISAASGDVLVLLNQDCLLQEGCLATLLEGLQSDERYGVAGCTLLNADGTVNHAGAYVQQPLAHGVHLTTPSDSVSEVEYVTGAVFALRRTVWQTVGAFDEGYFPAYYEDADYCYRARAKGYATAYVPGARAIHLLSGREWKRDPLKTWANQHRSRFRFVCKHFTTSETSAFFRAEFHAIHAESYLDQSLGRILAARDTLCSLTQILARRQPDLEGDTRFSYERILQEGFSEIFRQAYSAAQRLSGIVGSPSAEYAADGAQSAYQRMKAELASVRASLETSREAWQAVVNRMPQPAEMAVLGDFRVEQSRSADDEEREAAWQRREAELLTRICLRSPLDTGKESSLHRFLRQFVMRPISIITGRDALLRRRLAEAQRTRLREIMASAYREDMENRKLARLWREQAELIGVLAAGYTRFMDEAEFLLSERQDVASRRLTLMETLIRYVYR